MTTEYVGTAEDGDRSTPALVARWHGDVLTIVDYGTHSRAAAERHRDGIFELLQGREAGSVPAVVDLREADGVAPEARQVFREVVSHEALDRIAFVTDSTFMRIAATFVVRASGRAESARFFGDMGSAMAWLQS